MSDADAAPRSVGVVVVAAGSGTRLRADRPKAFVELGGRSLLERSVGQALRAGVSSVAVEPGCRPARRSASSRTCTGSRFSMKRMAAGISTRSSPMPKKTIVSGIRSIGHSR